MRFVRVQPQPAETPFVSIEMLAVDGVRTLNRTVYRDGAVKVTAQGGGGPWLRTQEEWDRETKGATRG